MSSALGRRSVPLNNMCSRKCERPAPSSLSKREPVPTSATMVAEYVAGMGCSARRNPLGKVVRMVSDMGNVVHPCALCKVVVPPAPESRSPGLWPTAPVYSYGRVRNMTRSSRCRVHRQAKWSPTFLAYPAHGAIAWGRSQTALTEAVGLSLAQPPLEEGSRV